MHLVCRNCSTPFTADLHLVPFDMRNEDVEEDFLKRGTLMQAEASYWLDHNVGNFLANLADVQHVTLTSDSSRLSGCCGLSGGTPNLQCDVCSAYVATRMDDCCTPHYIVFDPATTQAASTSGE